MANVEFILNIWITSPEWINTVQKHLGYTTSGWSLPIHQHGWSPPIKKSPSERSGPFLCGKPMESKHVAYQISWSSFLGSLPLSWFFLQPARGSKTTYSDASSSKTSLSGCHWWFPFCHRATPQSSSIFRWDFPWNKPSIRGYPQPYGNPHSWLIHSWSRPVAQVWVLPDG